MRYVRVMTSRSLQRAVDLARTGKTDECAPVTARAHLDSKAPAHEVFRVLADIARWPDVIPGVTRTEVLQEPLDTGSRFTWRNRGVPLRSTIQRIAPDQELTWTGQALWLIAVHRNTIEECDSGCRLTSEESMTGWGVRLFMPPATLERQLQAFVRSIADEAERLQ